MNIDISIPQNYDYIVDVLTRHNVCTEDELSLVLSINGTNIEVVNDIVYLRTGYRTFEQFYYEEGEKGSWTRFF